MSHDKKIQTLKGLVDIDSLGLILPHEHLFTDLRGPLVPDYAQAEVSPIHMIAPTGVYQGAFIPASLRETNGAVSEEQIRRITVDNPARAFAF